jgi:chromosome segregation ATPase
MPTQEERLTALEQNFASFRKEVATHIREVDENSTIMLGVMRDQGRDIKRTVQRLETIDERLDTMEQRLGTIDERLNIMEQRLDRLDTKFDEHTTLLTQILERLPKTS